MVVYTFISITMYNTKKQGHAIYKNIKLESIPMMRCKFIASMHNVKNLRQQILFYL